MDIASKLEDGFYIVRNLEGLLYMLQELHLEDNVGVAELRKHDFSNGPIIIEAQQSRMAVNLKTHTTTQYLARKHEQINAVHKFLGQTAPRLDYRLEGQGGKIVGSMGLPQPRNLDSFNPITISLDSWLKWWYEDGVLKHMLQNVTYVTGWEFAIQEDHLVALHNDAITNVFTPRPLTKIGNEGEWVKVDFIRNQHETKYYENGVATNN